ncbi:MAG: VCBS repeat-containing protein [Gemmatimonadota bacterium]|nr:VCBS repeat-containing protein [Gemmatimonadota bacterium]
MISKRGFRIEPFCMLFLMISFFHCTPEARHQTGESGSEGFRFRHHFIQQELERDAWGQTSMADIDKDGDLDFITGRRNGVIRWYEYRGPDSWHPHQIGERSPSDVGGLTLDVNGDGWLDMVAGGSWYENPGGSADISWTEHVFDPELSSVHDIVAADLDGDGLPEVLTMGGDMKGVTHSETKDLRWYKIPPAPGELWAMKRIGDSVHSGLAAADIDSDGDIDLVRTDIWLENKGGGRSWESHKIVSIPWDLASQAQVADINRDGRPDVVLAEGEITGARIAWFEAPADVKNSQWKPHILSQSDSEPRGPYHSLAVADFDNDGDLDIFTGEMEWIGKAPHRWFIWENISSPNQDKVEFTERVILDAGLGTHNAVIGDVDGDGDIDIAGKLWRSVKDNGNGGANHADFLENLTVNE